MQKGLLLLLAGLLSGAVWAQCPLRTWPDSLCQSESRNFLLRASVGGPARYAWATDASLRDVIAGASDSVLIVPASASGIYYVQAETALGCQSPIQAIEARIVQGFQTEWNQLTALPGREDSIAISLSLFGASGYPPAFIRLVQGTREWPLGKNQRSFRLKTDGEIPPCFQVFGTDFCQAEALSDVQCLPQLDLELTNQGLARLFWSPPLGWRDELDYYELSIRPPGFVNYIPLEDLRGPDTSLTFTLDYPQVCFQVRARNRITGEDRRSLARCFTLDTPIELPNIITPNQDGRNDVLHIVGLEKHPRAQVEIYNRWGQVVLQARPYNQNWSAEGLESGLYYVVVSGLNFGLPKKTWLQVLR